MTDFIQLVASLREQMSANLSRSDVLRPLAWLIGLLLTAFVGATIGRAPNWVLIVLLAGVGVALVVYIGAYVYCLFRDRDALRSERYTLQKMAIEHGIYGDSRVGLIEPSAATVAAPVAALTTERGTEEPRRR